MVAKSNAAFAIIANNIQLSKLSFTAAITGLWKILLLIDY